MNDHAMSTFTSSKSAGSKESEASGDGKEDAATSNTATCQIVTVADEEAVNGSKGTYHDAKENSKSTCH